jgi:hypothetical protein
MMPHSCRGYDGSKKEYYNHTLNESSSIPSDTLLRTPVLFVVMLFVTCNGCMEPLISMMASMSTETGAFFLLTMSS